MNVRSLLIVFVFVSSSSMTAQGGEVSSPADFQELGNKLVGRWMSDVTLIADWPGLEERAGDQIVGYTEFRWEAGRKAIVQTGTVGRVADYALWTHDPISGQIRGRLVNTTGSVLDAVFWKESESKWGFRMTGSISNGKKQKGSGHLSFSDGGKTFAWTSDDMSLDGKAIEKLRDISRRLGD